MKKVKKSSLSALPIDVAEYMFVEWLVRQGLYSAYRRNCENVCTSNRTFREDLHVRIRRMYRVARFSLEDIIAISFPFVMTSEGYDFWLTQSTLWRRFCNNFKSTL